MCRQGWCGGATLAEGARRTWVSSGCTRDGGHEEAIELEGWRIPRERSSKEGSSRSESRVLNVEEESSEQLRWTI